MSSTTRRDLPQAAQKNALAVEPGDFSRILSAVQKRLPRMHVADMTAALLQCADLVEGGKTSSIDVRRHPAFTSLLDGLYRGLEKLRSTAVVPQYQTMNDISRALAALEAANEADLLQLVAELGHQHIFESKPSELAGFLWSFAKLTTLEPSICESIEPLFAGAAFCIVRSPQDYSAHDLVQIALAFATAQQEDQRLFLCIAKQIAPQVDTLTCEELANVACSFSVTDVHDEGLFSQLAASASLRIKEFTAQEISTILWSFANMKTFHQNLFREGALAAQLLELRAQHFTNILWALSHTKPHHEITKAAIIAMLPKCERMIEDFTLEELSCVAMAAAKSYGRGSCEDLKTVPVEVTSFFEKALPSVSSRLNELSGASFANIVSAYLSVHVGCTSGLFFENEVIARARTLERHSLIMILRSLLETPSLASGQHALCALFGEAANHIDTFQPRELQSLARICSDLCDCQGELSLDEIRGCCEALAAPDTWAEMMPVKCSGEYAEESPCNVEQFEAHLNSDCLSTTATEEGWQSTDTSDSCFQAAPCATRCSDEKEVRPRGSTWPCPPTAGWVCIVKNTFLDIDDDNAPNCVSDTPSPLKPLPPSLDIIPSDIPLETLTAYRLDYQRFRAGNAFGAKGELHDIGLSYVA